MDIDDLKKTLGMDDETPLEKFKREIAQLNDKLQNNKS